LDYYNARYYDPVIGEFLTADVKQGNASGMDPYGYVGGNPETNTDPTGEYFAQMGDGGVVQSIARFSNTVVDGQRAISVWTETLGTRKTTTSTHKIHPTDPCTFSSCSVKLGKTVYSLDKLKHGDPQTRLDFLRDFYNQFAPGWGKAEGDFVAYLVKTGRITGGDGYWDVADFDLLRDQLVAAYDMINHQAAQSTLVGNWMAFVRHPNNDGWWVAHNGSINAGDQQARASGLYSKESWLEQRFINEAVHVVNGVQWVLHGEYNPLAGLGPQSPATGIFTQMFYPSGHDDFSVATSFANQAGFAVSNGGIIGLGVFLWSLT